MDRASLQTLTVLISDVVASTELRSRLGDATADLVQQAADDSVTALVRTHHGQVVKTLGDGVLATFRSAADALAAAAGIQQQAFLRRDGDPVARISLRIGLAAGDVAASGGDVTGTPVVEARRLCDVAGADQVLVTELVRLLSGSRGTAAFEPLGALDLRGLPAPVPASRLLWTPVEEGGAGHGVDVPPLLVREHSLDYVGRQVELGRLTAELGAALDPASPARAVLLSGEPGIGKTRTAAMIATSAAEAGAVVLYGRCDEDLHSAYQPFVEGLAAYARQARSPRLGRLAGELVRLEADLARLVPGVGRPLETDVRSEEFRLFEAVTEWLIAASEEQGLVFVVDDLQWADQPTLMLVRHLLRRVTASDHRLLIVGTYRDDHDDTSHLPAVLVDLRRMPGISRHRLTGLSETDVVDIMEAVAGHELDGHGRILARILRAETEGNPLFVAEVLQHLRETGAIRLIDGRWVVAKVGALEVPDTVREVVSRRLDRLPAGVRSLLTVAAVVGRDFTVLLLAGTTGRSEEDVVDALEVAVAARLVDETGADHYRFNHVLVRGTLYDELSATRRRRLHQRVAAVFAAQVPQDVVALAHHHLAAGPTGSAVIPAAGWAVAAAEQAQDGRALAEAGLLFEQARSLLSAAEPAPAEAQPLLARALCGLGETQRDQGEPGFRESLTAAATLARALGDTSLLVRAVLANDRGSTLVTSPDPGRVALIEAALHAVGPQPSPARARLLTRLVGETTFAGDAPRRRKLTLEVERMARALNEEATLAHVLVRTGMAAHRLTSPEEALARAVEGSQRALALGDPALGTLALSWVSAALVVLGRLREAVATAEQMVQVAAAASPSVRLFARLNGIKFLAASGRLEAARAENDACLELAVALREPDAEPLWAAVTAAIAVCSGTTADFAEVAGLFADQQPSVPNWRAGHVAFLAEAGRLDDVRTQLSTRRLDPALMMEEPFAYQGPFSLAMVARRLGDAQGARLGARCRLLLEPHAAMWSHIYIGILGPVAWPLGWCAMATGDWDTAVARLADAWRRTHLPEATGLHRLIGADYAEALRARGGVGDRKLAAAVAGGQPSVDLDAVTQRGRPAIATL